MRPGTRALAQIVAHFGEDVLLPDGALDRPKLGRIIFNDEKERKALNAIVHPAVRRAMAWCVLGHWWRGERVCVLDVPLLIEGGLWKWVASVVLVYWYVLRIPPPHQSTSDSPLHPLAPASSPEIQLQRLMKRDGSTRDDASSRLRAQLPIASKVGYADIVIDNSGSPADLEDQVDALVKRLKREAGWSWRLAWWCPPLAVVSAAWTIGWRAAKRQRKPAKKGRAT